MLGMSIKRISVLNLCHVLKPFVKSTPDKYLSKYVVGQPVKNVLPSEKKKTTFSMNSQYINGQNVHIFFIKTGRKRVPNKPQVAVSVL